MLNSTYDVKSDNTISHNYIPGWSWFKKKVLVNWVLYLFILPALTYILIFNYIPIYGVQIAFKNFNYGKGIWESDWVGLDHFIRFFNSSQFWALIRNTLVLSIYSVVAGFPIPVTLAILINYCGNIRFKRFVQMITYAPHFISVVVLVGMIMIFLSPRTGFINQLYVLFGGKPVNFLGESELFSTIYVWSGIWQNAGWGSIIYTAALSSINPELHEAAIVDGARKLQRIWYIDIPGILPTITIMLILSLGNILGVGFEKTFLLQNPANLDASEVISTYVYKMGLQNNYFSYSAAIGLFNNIVNFIILLAVNRIAKAVNKTSLF